MADLTWTDPDTVETKKSSGVFSWGQSDSTGAKDAPSTLAWTNPDEPLEPPSLFKETGKALVRGVGGVGQMTGHVLKAVGATGTGTALDAASEKLSEAYPMPPEVQESFVKRGMLGGVESMLPSVTAGLPGAVVGFAAKKALWPAAIGYALSGGSVMGVAEYQNFLDDYEKEHGKAPDTHVKAMAALSGLAEGGFEAASDLLGGKLLFGTPAKVAGTSIKSLLRTPFGIAAKKYAQVKAAEVATEMATSASEAYLRQQEGIPTDTPWAAAKEAIIPAMVMSDIFTAGTVGLKKLRNNRIESAMSDPTIAPEDRARAAGDIYQTISESYVDPKTGEITPEGTETLTAWKAYAENSIVNKLPIDLDLALDPLSLQIESAITEDPAGKTLVYSKPVAPQVETDQNLTSSDQSLPLSDATETAQLPAPLPQTPAATVGETGEAKSGESLNPLAPADASEQTALMEQDRLAKSWDTIKSATDIGYLMKSRDDHADAGNTSDAELYNKRLAELVDKERGNPVEPVIASPKNAVEAKRKIAKQKDAAIVHADNIAIADEHKAAGTINEEQHQAWVKIANDLKDHGRSVPIVYDPAATHTLDDDPARALPIKLDLADEAHVQLLRKYGYTEDQINEAKTIGSTTRIRGQVYDYVDGRGRPTGQAIVLYKGFESYHVAHENIHVHVSNGTLTPGTAPAGISDYQHEEAYAARMAEKWLQGEDIFPKPVTTGDNQLNAMAKSVKPKGAKRADPETGSLFSIETVKAALEENPAAGAVPDYADKTITLTHWSNQANLTTLDPEKHGTQHKGAEFKRQSLAQDEFVNRSYLGLPGYTREWITGPEKYAVKVEGNSMYDLYEDPLKMAPTQQEMAATRYGTSSRAAWLSMYEKRIKEAGFAGYISTPTHAAALFIPTNSIEKVPYSAQALPVNPAKSEMPKFAITTDKGAEILKNGSTKKFDTIVQMAEHLQRRVSVDYKNSNPRQNRVIEKLLTEFIDASIAKYPQAVDWYRKDYANAFKYLEMLDPDLKKPANRFRMNLATAFSSNGNTGVSTFEIAWSAYQNWKQNGKYVPTVGSERRAQIEENFLLADALWGHFKSDIAMEKWLLKETTVAELRKDISKKVGGVPSTWIPGESPTATVPRSVIFGPKLGAFFANLSGNFDPVTMDRWAMRTIGRLAGDLIKDADIAGLRGTFRSTLTPEIVDIIRGGGFQFQSIDELSDTEVDGLAMRLHLSAWRDLDHKYEKARKAGNGLGKALKGQLRDAPRGPVQRAWIRERVKNIRKARPDLDPATIQAAAWIGEKGVYHELGGARETADYYSDGARLLYERLNQRNAGQSARAAGQARPANAPGATQTLFAIGKEGVEEQLDKTSNAVVEGVDESTLMGKILALVKDNPWGFTIKTTDGTLVPKGYAVAPEKTTATVYDNLTEQDVEAYIDKFQPAFEADERAFLGGWQVEDQNSPDFGKFVMDVSYVVDDLELAVFLAKNGEQDGIYHIDGPNPDERYSRTDSYSAGLQAGDLLSEEERAELRGIQTRLRGIISQSGANQVKLSSQPWEALDMQGSFKALNRTIPHQALPNRALDAGPEPASAPRSDKHQAILAGIKDPPWKWTASNLVGTRLERIDERLNKIWGPEEDFDAWRDGGEVDKKRYYVLLDNASELDRAVRERDVPAIKELLKDIQRRLQPQDYYAYEVELSKTRERSDSLDLETPVTGDEQIPAAGRTSTSAKKLKAESQPLFSIHGYGQSYKPFSQEDARRKSWLSNVEQAGVKAGLWEAGKMDRVAVQPLYFQKLSVAEAVTKLGKEPRTLHTPSKTVYHVGNPRNRENILANGLSPKKGEQLYGNKESYKPSIYLTDAKSPAELFDSTYDDDVYAVTTTGLANKFFKDPNYEKNTNHIVTFDGIPAENIKLIHEGTGVEKDKLSTQPGIKFSIQSVDGIRIDPNGIIYDGDQPKVFYRGARNETSIAPFFFSDSEKAAKKYGKVEPVSLEMRNPKVIDFQGEEDNDLWDELENAQVEGHDGVVAKNTFDGWNEHDQYVVFSKDQIRRDQPKFSIVSAFKALLPQPQATPPQTTQRASFDTPESSPISNFIYTFVNRQVDLHETVDNIKNFAGTVADVTNAALKEILYSGRVGKRVSDFLDKEMAPIYERLAKENVSLDDIETYLHNRHAEEANNYIATINPDLPDKGSGIKTADARAYLAGLSIAERNKLEAISKMIDRVNRQTATMMVEYNLESQEMVDKWFNKYQHYVPLFREQATEGSLGNGSGQGFSTLGPGSRRRKGSTSTVVDIMANIASQRERVITRGEKNIIATALYGLAKANPNPDFWALAKPGIKNAVSAETGDMVAVVDTSYKTRDNVVMSRQLDKKTGKIIEKGVEFSTQNERSLRMAKALKNLDMDNLGKVLGTTAQVTRFIASMNTQYNPVFGFINFARDVQTAMFNLTTTPIAGKQKEVFKGSFAAIKGIFDTIRADRTGTASTNPLSRLWEEFQLIGGETGYRDLFTTTADRTKQITKQIENFKKGKTSQIIPIIGKYLSDYNTILENSVRLSAYKVGIANGMSKDQAAAMAKNLTVNFNKKGQIATQAGALYAFFNASVQGSARLYETLKGPKGMKIIMAGVVLGTLQAMILAAAGFKDDEPPEFIKERNLVIPIGGKKYLTIPLPLGLHILPNVGRLTAEIAMNGFKDPVKKTADMFGVMLEGFNPMGASGLALQSITPTALDPLTALAENKDWTGKAIYRDNFSSLAPTPGYTRTKDAATIVSKKLAWALNRLSGGTDYKPGLFSPTPDQIDFLVGQALGGVGREGIKVAQTATAMSSGEDLPLYKIPLVGRVLGSAEGSSQEATKFYSNLKRMNAHELEVKGRIKNRESVSEYYQENPDAKLWRMSNSAEATIARLNQRKRDMIEKGGSKEAVKTIELLTATHMKRFNDRIEAAKAG